MTTAHTPIRILVADDHALIRLGVGAVVNLQSDMMLVGEATDGSEAVEAFRRLKPDVALIDLQMPNMDGLEAIAAIVSEFPSARLIVLTTYAGDAQALRAMRAGAAGYLLKSTLRKELLDVIRTVHSGEFHIPPEIANDIGRNAMRDALSEREIEVLRCIARGLPNKGAARELGVSEETVKAHVKSIFGKLNVADRTEAVTIAARRGILDLSPGSDAF
ncbi:response regulator [Sphingomonas xinjiangensis]|uniref:DNA-binding NarL/FixJ family response regulator n=1 Tax=Sphingomonas xinjiangensis TaxID=643568 RepID=A0A840YR21_9SPHN|nr:response regulator transcription factor [Sphingomonas xinjiangensis]MBB5711821.1 DNA-binding NarL/FixJ family response regulator [Sphingomonas xinjiangensis]